ncbi:MAG: hydrogenase maturation protease [Dehalococcoidia bacterium]
MQQLNDIVVVGLGNTLMTDEGIGIHVLCLLMSESGRHDHIDMVEAGSSVMSVVHSIAGRRKAIIIDCARMSEPAGTIRRFTPSEVESTKSLPHLSLHEGDLLTALRLSRDLGEHPDEVVIFGIQPETIAPGDSLSSTLQERLDYYLETIASEFHSASHTPAPGTAQPHFESHIPD